MIGVTLAFRNLQRNYTRTLYTLGIVAVGIASLVVFEGFITEQMKGFRTSVIMGGIGHIQVAASEGYFDKGEFNPENYQISNAGILEEKILRLPGVRRVVPSTGLTALAAYGEKTVTLLIKAYPAEAVGFKTGKDGLRDEVFRLGRLTEGRGYTRSGEIVLGERIARILGAVPGTKITLVGVTGVTGLKAQDAEVVGVYRGVQDNLFAYADYDFVRELSGTSAPSAFTVILDRLEDTKSIAAEIAAFHGEIGPLALRTWNVLAVYFRQVNAMLAAFLQVIRLILLLVTVFIIANTMTMTVFERMREIGALRAIGATRSGVFSMLFMEGGLLGLVGGVAGIGIGFALCALLNLAGGIRYPYQGEVFRILFVPSLGASLSHLPPITVFACFGSFVPARKAASLTVAETLRAI